MITWDISPAEWEALAQIYEESLGHHTEENREIQERYLESLFSDGTEEEKVSRIMEYLPEKETAYYTLQRMENICLPEGSGEKYKIEVISREGQQVYEIKSVMADTLVEVPPP